MDADEALQMFFDEEDGANVPIARFSDSDLPESDDVELTDDWAGHLSSPDEETASSDEENLYGGSQGRTQHSSKVANEPPLEKSTCFFFLFLLSPTEACFLTNESKANEFERRSFATLELKLRSSSCRRTATAADGLGGVWVGSSISRSRWPKGERDAHGIAVRVVEAMWCSVAIRAGTIEKKRAVFECLGGRL